MPLLMCPNDNAAMQTLERNGVQFDMCPEYGASGWIAASWKS